jgi:hypothetical protein
MNERLYLNHLNESELNMCLVCILLIFKSIVYYYRNDLMTMNMQLLYPEVIVRVAFYFWKHIFNDISRHLIKDPPE